jgi:transposase InsO family protein
VEILRKASAFFATRAVTTDSNHKLKPSPNLLEQKFHCQTPNTVWLVDITYNDTDEGWLYLAGIKDMATREIVGWAMEDHMRAELCYEALKMALGRRGPVPGLINHSDRRSQYAGGKYRELIGKAHLTQSMSRKGECLDNAPMESFFASLKKNWCTASALERARRPMLLSLNTSRFSTTGSAGIPASATKHLYRLLKI